MREARLTLPMVKWVVLALLCGVLWKVIDPVAAWQLLVGVHWPWLLPALGLLQLQIVLSALRWRYTAERLGRALGHRRVISEYYLAMLLNQTLPGGVSGDAARAWRNRDGGTLAVVIERMTGQVAFLLVTVIGLACWPWLVGGPAPAAGYRLLVGAGVLIGLLCLLVVTLRRIGGPRFRNAMHRLTGALHLAWFAERSWRVQAALSLCIVATYLLVFALCAQAIGVPLPLAGLVTVVPLALLSMLVPVTVGGWGVREAAAAALWPLVGLAAEAGVATSVLYGLISLVGSLPGLLVWMQTPRASR